MVSTRATCHAARINAVREWASSTALSKRCTAGSSSCMVSCRHSIGHRSPLEPLAKESKSVPFFRCYASPPRTEMSAPKKTYESLVQCALYKMSVKKHVICSKESTNRVNIIVRDSVLIVFYSVQWDIQQRSFRIFFKSIVLQSIIGLMPGKHVD